MCKEIQKISYSIELWLKDEREEFYRQDHTSGLSKEELNSAASEFIQEYGLDFEQLEGTFQIRIYEHTKTRRDFNIIPPVKAQIVLI